MRPASEAEKARLNETFAELCRIPSPFGDERAIADEVTARLRAMGLEVSEDDAAGPAEAGAGNLLARIRGRSERSVLLCAHLDTVGFGGMTEPTTPRIQGDRLNGRGAYDMKAGLAAALAACRELADTGLAGDVVVAAVADEEHESLGVQEALRAVRADGAVVTEPTELELVVAHKGFVWSEIEITGRAAHGSRPHLGTDAIVKAGPILSAVGALDTGLAERVHPRLGRGSIHAGRIAGGGELSSYPGRCVVALERRTLPGETGATGEAELAALLDGCRADDPALVAAQRTLLERSPFEQDEQAAIVRAVGAAAAEVLGAPPPLAGASYWADAALIAAAGIPTVMLGPGGAGAHATEEWVSLPDTVAVARTLIAAGERF